MGLNFLISISYAFYGKLVSNYLHVTPSDFPNVKPEEPHRQGRERDPRSHSERGHSTNLPSIVLKGHLRNFA